MVYFLTSEAMRDKIKIGYSRDPEQRRKGLTLPGTKIVATIAGGKAVERELHQRFRRARIKNSEWFWYLPEIADLVREVQNGQKAS